MEIFEMKMRREDLIRQAGKLIPKTGSMTSEERERFDALYEQVDEVHDQIVRAQRADENHHDKITQGIFESQPGSAGSNAEQRGQKQSSKRAKYETPEQREYHEAFNGYLRTGDRSGLTQYRDMGVGSPTQSTPTSVLVPQGFVYDIDVAMKYYGPLLQVADVLDTDNGAPMPYPNANDTGTMAEIVGEGVQVADADVNVSAVILGAYKFSTKLVKVSLELIQDSAFDIETFLQEQFAIRLGRGLNTLFTTGTGSNQPTGILTAAAAGPMAVGSSGNTGGSETGGTSIGTDDLLALIYSVDKIYRQGAAFQASDLTIQKILQLKDKYGRPIFQQPETGQPASLFGYPLLTNNDLVPIPSVAGAGNKTMLFGQFKKYKIRRVKGLTVLRLTERFADYGQVAFIGFARYDGNLIDAGTHPVKYLLQASS